MKYANTKTKFKKYNAKAYLLAVGEEVVSLLANLTLLKHTAEAQHRLVKVVHSGLHLRVCGLWTA